MMERLLLIVCLGMMAFCIDAVAQPPPASAYGQLPTVADAALSPDGTKLALAVNVGDEQFTNVLNIDDGALVLSLKTQPGDTLRRVGWADDGMATFVLSHTFRRDHATPAGWIRRGGRKLLEYWRVGTVTVPDGQMKLMMQNEDASWAMSHLSHLIAPVADDPGYGRMFAFTDLSETGRFAVYRVNLRTGDGRLDFASSSDTWSFVLDDRGAAVARTETTPQTNRWRLFAMDRSASRLIAEGVSDTGLPPTFRGLFADGRLASVDAPDDRDRDTLYAWSLGDGARTLMFEAPSHDIDDVIADPWTRRVVGVAWTDDLPQQRFFDADLEGVRKSAASLFPGGFAEIVSWSRNRQRFLLHAERANDAGAYYLLEAEPLRLRKIFDDYPKLPLEGVHEVQALSYAARDGVRIPAYFTIPDGVEPRNLPMVVLVHGGPHARDAMTFDYWAQFLASRGYSVLQPNFRGSSGYGSAWLEAGRREWGGRMQTDVEDGVAALVRSGRVDPARVCIVGASYGGYAALAGAALTPGRYACAVSVNGVTDLPAMLAQEVRGDAIGPNADYWQLSIGKRSDDGARIAAASPSNRTADIRIPILLLHSTEDTVVPPEKSKQMYRRLLAAGKSARIVELTGEDHWLSSARTRTRMLEETETFLAQHLAPRPVQAPN